MVFIFVFYFLIIFLVVHSSTPCKFNVEPIKTSFGAKISGIDVRHVNDECIEIIRSTIHAYRLLIFQDQQLTWEEQVYSTD